MANRRIWLLKLVFPFRYGKWLTGLLLLSVLLPFFYLGVEEEPGDSTPALFFSLIIAYIIPIFSFITEKSQEALLELRSFLSLDEQAFEQAQARLDSVSRRGIAIQLTAGALGGFIHMSFVRGSVSAAVTAVMTSVPGFMSTLGALLVWVVMTTVISMLIQQAMLFARLGRNNVRLSLLNTRSLLPFARVSISSSLAIIGALALFPLISLDSGLNLVESLPGAIATLVPMVAMFIIPVWPVHQRMARMKTQQLATLNDEIEARLGDSGEVAPDSGALEPLVTLLSYRREIARASTWPFDLGNVSRLAFYMVIPPLTWVAAALIENLVDSVL